VSSENKRTSATHKRNTQAHSHTSAVIISHPTGRALLPSAQWLRQPALFAPIDCPRILFNEYL
jgi:hypothetical protein